MTAPHMHLAGKLAPRDAWAATRCSLDATFGVIGTRSAVLILREAYYGTTRFDDFVVRTGLTEAVMAARLKELVGVGILERRPYQEPGRRSRSEYALTDSGEELLPAMLGLMQWGDKHLASRTGGPPIALKHRDCGQRIVTRVECEAGHEVALDEIEVRGARTR